MAEPEFSPEEHRSAASRYLDDLAVGERFEQSRRSLTPVLIATALRM